MYPNSQACRWTMQAPAGFIIQLTFLDFYLEEAQSCMYDRVVVHTGSADVKFCGPTANGLTLNSTGNVMELLFTSDFSVQKKGFAVSFKRGRSGLAGLHPFGSLHLGADLWVLERTSFLLLSTVPSVLNLLTLPSLSLLPPPPSCCGPQEPEGPDHQRQRPDHPAVILCFRADAQ